ncbi:MAG: hypothetical protein ACP5OG_00880 [Candidatus Nanoarchaeia archaeon]
MTSKNEMQLGKNGLTREFLDDIKRRFDIASTGNIKVHVLQSARESREDVKKYAEEIRSWLGDKYTYKILGFSIFVKKWRKAKVNQK